MTDQTMADALLWAFGVALFALMTWGCVAQRTPAAALRRLLTFLHHLGGATLVWDAAQGATSSAPGPGATRMGYGTPSRSRSCTSWMRPATACPCRTPGPACWGPSHRVKSDCADDARTLAQHYTREPGHYILALPAGAVISAPSHRPAVQPEPTPRPAPLPVPPTADHTPLAAADISVRAFVSGPAQPRYPM